VKESHAAVEVFTQISEASAVSWEIFGEKIEYDAENGILSVNGKKTDFGRNIREFRMLIDIEILEISAEQDTVNAAYEVAQKKNMGMIQILSEKNAKTEIYII
jgi:hypothetical protein